VQADLARAAGTLGLGLRAGERRFALRNLLAQDARAVLTWLADEARSQSARYAGALAPWWRMRAEAGAAWLGALSDHCAMQ
jgi:hypothetical protein